MRIIFILFQPLRGGEKIIPRWSCSHEDASLIYFLQASSNMHLWYYFSISTSWPSVDETKGRTYTIISTTCLVPTRLGETMAECRRGRVTVLSTCLKPIGSDTPLLGNDEAIATHTHPHLTKSGRYMTGHRRGESHPLHRHILLVTPTWRQYTWPGIGETKPPAQEFTWNITCIWMSNPTHDDDYQRSLIGGIPWVWSHGCN